MKSMIIGSALIRYNSKHWTVEVNGNDITKQAKANAETKQLIQSKIDDQNTLDLLASMGDL